MKNLNIFESFLNRLKKGKTTYRITKGCDAYKFYSTECPNYFIKDNSGSFLVSDNNYEIDTMDNGITQVSFDRKIVPGTEAYQYIRCEYRQNSPIIDIDGNYLLNDEMILTKRR
jgi:hypothetical protein